MHKNLMNVLKKEKAKGDAVYYVDKNGKPTNVKIHEDMIGANDSRSNEALEYVTETKAPDEVLSLFK